MKPLTKPTRAVAKKVMELLDHGLTRGLGKAEPGKMCVEAAVCYAMGQPHGDNPKCVGATVRAYKIALNDSERWPSDAARADGMRRLAIAQLGSDTLDQSEFAERITIGTVNKVLPLVVKDADLRKACEGAMTLEEARVAAYAADAAAYAAYAVAYAADARALTVSAEMVVQVLVDMKSPGAAWLDLCPLPAAKKGKGRK